MDALGGVSALAAIALAWGVWRLCVRSELRGTVWVLVFGSCAIAVAALAPPQPIMALLSGYPSDSLYTLAVAPRAGVIVLSTILVLGLLGAVAAVTKLVSERLPDWLALDAALACAIVLAGVGLTVSLQLYYAYYSLVTPGLPEQWVIAAPLDPIWIIERAVFASPDNMANHLRGAVFWASLLLVPLYLAKTGFARRASITFFMAVIALAIVSRLAM